MIEKTEPCPTTLCTASLLERSEDGSESVCRNAHAGWLYFIRRSGWERAADDGTMREGAAGDGPVIVRVPLAPPRYRPFAALATLPHRDTGAFAVGATPAMYSRRMIGTGSAP